MAKTQEINTEPVFYLKNFARGVVWHESFPTREMAQGCIDYYRKEKGVDGGWEIIEVKGKQPHD